MAKGGKHDPTTMRRAGRPSVEPRKGPPSMTGFADQSARHKTMARSLVRPVVVPVASLNKQQPRLATLTSAPTKQVGQAQGRQGKAGMVRRQVR